MLQKEIKLSGNLKNSTKEIVLSNRTKITIAVALVLFGVISRYLPHPPNFAPIAAIGLFAGVYLPRRYAVALPLIAMVISDIFLGFHGLIFWTWGSFALIGLFSSQVLRKNVNPGAIVASSIGASLLFYLVTNFGVWAEGLLYPQNFTGLASSYLNALPFLRNTLLGDLAYTVAIFASYEVAVLYARQVKTRLVLA